MIHIIFFNFYLNLNKFQALMELYVYIILSFEKWKGRGGIYEMPCEKTKKVCHKKTQNACICEEPQMERKYKIESF